MSNFDERFSIGIVGRTNVGKSSLFNQLLGFRRAIVLDEPQTTLDILEEVPKWGEVQGISLLDTQGWFDNGSERIFEQVLERAKAFLFVVDASAGLSAWDDWFSKKIKKTQKPVLLVVNKIDRVGEAPSDEFYNLGFDLVFVSAAHHQNIDVIKSWCVKLAEGVSVNSYQEPMSENKALTIVFLGRPNSGKSTLMNRLAGTLVSQVGPAPLTTRDPVGFMLSTPQGRVRILDTAGIRRPRVSKSELELFSTQAAIRAMHSADVVFLLIPGHEQIADQDMRLFSLIERQGKNPIILINFWDRVRSDFATYLSESEFGQAVRFYKVIPVSTKTGYNVERVVPLAFELYESSKRRVKTSRLNQFVDWLTRFHPPPSQGRYAVNILYASQVKTEPPTFVFFLNRAHDLPESYRKFILHRLKKDMGFRNQNIRIIFRTSR